MAAGDTEPDPKSSVDSSLASEIPEPRGGGILARGSPMRRTQPEGQIPSLSISCEHAIACAGCPLIHLDYPSQLQQKRARVVAAAAHYSTLDLVYTRPVAHADPMTGYRGRAKLIVSPRGAIGLYSRSGNHDVVDIPSCRVLAPALAEVALALRSLVADPPDAGRALLVPYDALAGGVLRAVDLREVSLPRASRAVPDEELAALEPSRSGVLVTFVLQRDRAHARDELVEAARSIRARLPRVVGIAANFHEAEAPQILGPETIALDGAAQAEDRIGNVYHLASFGSFVQAHRGQAARVHAMILQEVEGMDLEGGRAPRVLDLYGGSGAISLALSAAGAEVTMVESFAPATDNARAAAAAQGIASLKVLAGDVAEVASHLVASRERFDAIVVNPPRRGVSPAAREAIARLGAPILVYVSCDPDTLVRDLDHFARVGYASNELVPFDMIPLTDEVETVSVLRRAPPPPPHVLYEDEDVLVVDKGPHEPLEAQSEYVGSLVQRCQRLPDCGAALPTHALDPGTSGLAVLAKNEKARAAWSQALAQSGRLIYLAAAKGVTPAKGAITRDLREGGRAYPARTRYRRLAIASGHSILRVIPDGGRPHQIRRHLAAIGHPVLGDERYGHLPTNRYFEEKHGLDRSFVHLIRIEVNHPLTGARLLIESALPGDLRSSLERATGSSVLKFLEQKHALGSDRASSIPPPMESSASESQPPPSSRYEPDATPEPSQRVSVMPESTRVPDLDTSPRTLRRPITDDDE